jgi:hypothetical protein
MNDAPADKIRMLKASMRCLGFGLAALLPVVGLPFTLAAISSSYSARRLEKQFWNPAKPYRILGLICGILGALIWIMVVAIVSYNAVVGGFDS